MLLIKRYANRKLYDTSAREYITLEHISQLVQRGETVQVVDHETGEDITALTYAQVICDLEKNQPGFLPISILASLLKDAASLISLSNPLLHNNLVETELKQYIPSKTDIDLLTNQIEELETRINRMLDGNG